MNERSPHEEDAATDRAWEEYAKNNRGDLQVNWIAISIKEAFYAGFRAAGSP